MEISIFFHIWIIGLEQAQYIQFIEKFKYAIISQRNYQYLQLFASALKRLIFNAIPLRLHLKFVYGAQKYFQHFIYGYWLNTE